MDRNPAALRWGRHDSLRLTGAPSAETPRDLLARFGLGREGEAQHLLGPWLGEFLALARETNPDILDEALFQLGQRLETGDRLPAASQIYGVLASENTALPAVRLRAQERLDAMTGVGSFAARSEFLLRRLAYETMEPTTLVGMTTAALAYRLTRVATLSRLLGSPSANLLTRGFGAQAAASLLGFGVEATAFPLATRGTALALGRSLDWSPAQLGRELASSFMVLGGMKLTGWAASRGPASVLRQQAGMLGGIVLAHRLETAVGLRPQVDGATTWVDAFGMLLQFNAAGGLARGLMGPGFHAWETRLDLQARHLAATPLPRGGRPLEFLELNPAVAGLRPQFETREPTLTRLTEQGQVIQMSTGGGSGDGGGPGGKDPGRKPPTLTLPGLGSRSTLRLPSPPPPAPGSNAGTPKDGDSPADRISPAPPERKATLPGIPSPKVNPATAITEPEIPAARGVRPPPPAAPPPPPVVRDPAPAPAPRKPSTPAMFSLKSRDYVLEGMLPTTPVYPIPAARNVDPVESAAVFIERQMRSTPETTIFELAAKLNPTQTNMMRIEMHRIFREVRPIPGVLIVIALPESKTAIMYNFRGGNLHAFPVSLREPRGAARRLPTIPPGAGSSPAQPKESAERPSAPSLISATEHRGESVACNTFEEVKRALREILEANPEKRGISPALRLNHGVLGTAELESLAPYFLEFPLPEGHKVTVLWTQNGGGRLIFQRDGDRLTASVRGLRAVHRDYALFPKDENGNELLIHPLTSLRSYKFPGLRTYEMAADRSLEALVKAVSPESVVDSSLPTEERGAHRGRLMALAVTTVLRRNSGNWITVNPADQRAILEVQEHLERAYTFLDFDTVNHFYDRMTDDKLKRYGDWIYQINRLPTANRTESLTGIPEGPQWLLPSEMPTAMPSFEWVPKREHLQDTFVNQLFSDSGGLRSPRETLFLLNDIDRLARVTAATFRSRFSTFPTRRARIMSVAPGNTLATFLGPNRSGLTSVALEMREQMIDQLRDLSEFSRIFFEGKGHIYRRFLTGVFNGPGGIAGLYRQMEFDLGPLPQEVKNFLELPLALPPEERLQRYIKGLPTPQR